MGAWSEAYGAQDIQMLSDGNGEFTAAMGLAMDGSELEWVAVPTIRSSN